MTQWLEKLLLKFLSSALIKWFNAIVKDHEQKKIDKANQEKRDSTVLENDKPILNNEVIKIISDEIKATEDLINGKQ